VVRSDAILLVIIPALQAPDVASSRALRLARELDSEGLYEGLKS
jgi:dynamin GTPase